MFILDYRNQMTEIPGVTIGDDTILDMWIETLTGDEILHVTRKDGSEEEYDSSSDRVMDFYDSELQIVEAGKIVLSEEELNEFQNRQRSVGYY